MEGNKFRFKLNLFDTIVLVLAFCVAAVLGYKMMKPAATEETATSSVETVRYTVQFQKMLEGTGSLIRPGDELEDTVKNYKLGTVVSTEIIPATMRVLDVERRKVVQAEIPGREDVLVLVEAPCTMGESSLLLDGGYKLRVNAPAYIRGNGYMAVGPIVSIEREEQK